MAGQVSLDSLIQGIAGAVIEAQEQIEKQQIANISAYFDGDNRPRSILLRVPSMAADAKVGDEDFYRAPLLSLVPNSPLRIKDVRISFDANLGEIGPASTAPGQPPDAAGTAASGPDDLWAGASRAPDTTVHIDPAAGPGGRGFGAVRVVMRVESCEPPEGAARLLNHLAQTQGVVKTVNTG